MRNISLLAALFILLLTQSAMCQVKAEMYQTQDQSFEFNGGQVSGPDNKPEKSVRYFARLGGMRMYCRANSLLFSFLKPVYSKEKKKNEGIPGQADRPEKMEMQDMELFLLGANPNPQIIGEEKGQAVSNYYKSGPDLTLTDVAHYNKLVYKNIYPGIDMRLQIAPSLKYEFIVQPGADPALIRLQWKGTQKENLSQEGKFFHANDLGYIREDAPVSFQQGNENINSSFRITGSEIHFDLGKYDNSRILVIDPKLEYGTYFGGPGRENMNKLFIDTSGCIYLTGLTSSGTKIATSGVYQLTPAGGSDAFLEKFYPDKSRAWGTYFGGSGTDEFNSLAVSATSKKYIVCAGYTETSLSSTYCNLNCTNLGMSDGLLACFDSSGRLNWSTLLGGTMTDRLVDVALDKSNHIFTSGIFSTSTCGTTGTYQPKHKGYSDILIAKYTQSSTSITLNYATYYGGPGQDNVNSMRLDAQNNIYICGYTSSGANIATSGAIQSTSRGKWDAFIAKIKNDGTSLLWGTYYGGKSDDFITSLALDKMNNLYFLGRTGSDSFISTPGSFQPYTNSLSLECFVGKLDSSLSKLHWCTYYGGDKDETDRSMVISPKNDFLIIGGKTLSSKNLATSGAYMTSPYYTPDAFLAYFDTSGRLRYSTYFGGNSSDEIASLAFNPQNKLVFGGNTSSTNQISTPLSYQSSLSGTNTDGFFGVFSGFSPPPPPKISGANFSCLAGQVNYSTTFSKNIFKWAVSKGHIVSGQGTNSVVISWDTIGTGWVKLIEKDSAWGADSSTISVNILNSTTTFSGLDSVCKNSNAYYIAPSSGIKSYAWTVTGGNVISGSTTDSLKIHWTTPGKGTVTLIANTTSGCRDSVTKTVKVFGLPNVNISGADSVCHNASAIFINSAPCSGCKRTWTVINGNYTPITKYDSIKVTFPKSSTSAKISLLIQDTKGCFDSASHTLNFYALPKIGFKIPANICAGQPVSFSDIIKSSSSYKWFFGDGDSAMLSPTSHSYIKPGKFTPTLIAWNKQGCSDTLSSSIIINSNPNPAWSIKSDSVNFLFHFIPTDTTLSYYHWSFGDGDTSLSTKASHKYAANNTYKVSLAVRNSFGCQSQKDSLFKVFVTSVSDSDPASGYSAQAWPNPFQDVLHVEIKGTNAGFNIQILSMEGKLLRTISGHTATGSDITNIEINVKDLQQGLYLLHVHADTDRFIKIVK